VRLPLAADDRLVKSIRRGDPSAFERLYDRHAAELLSFCVYMLGSRHDAEDAVQATFTSAYKWLLADNRPVTLRPWLFTIARNACLSILRRRHPTAELNGEPALTGDPQRELELREEVRQLLKSLLSLPERQRTTLTLAELHGLSHSEIATVLGVRTDQVKAYAYQARANLISDRGAHETDCRDIRKELATARGVALRQARLHRHLRTCSECRAYKQELSHQRQQLAALLPVAPTLALKLRAFQDVLDNVGLPGQYVGGAAVAASAAGTAAVAGGGAKALVAKVAAGVAALGAGAGVGAAVLDGPIAQVGHSPAASAAEATLPRLSAASAQPAQSPAGGLARARYLSAGPSIGAPRGRGRTSRMTGPAEEPAERSGTSGTALGGTRRGSGQPSDAITAHGVASGRKLALRLPRPAEEERRRQLEAAQRQREARQRLHEARQQLSATRAAKAAQEHRLAREERQQVREQPRAARPPKDEEALKLQHEKRQRQLEARRSSRVP
jgi:RNA polymerase sigma factor (sigma-70 family)